MKPRNVVLACLGISLIVGFTLLGGFLYDSFIGLDASAFPLGIHGIAWFLGGMAAILVITATLVVRSVRTRVAATDPARRSFLTGAASGAGAALGATALGGLGAFARAGFGVGNEGRGWMEVGQGMGAEAQYTDPNPKESWKGSRVASHRRFGRTEWQVSDVVLGTGRIKGENGEQIARLALERGVNYFDTSPDYSGHGSEQAMGRAVAAHGSRDKMFIATKFCTADGHLGVGASVARYKEVVEGSLSRLGTDYVDLVHIHSCDEVERLLDPNVHEAFDQLKQEGKVRFLGFSSHTPRLVEVANAAIDSGRFDVMMLAYHHGIWAPLSGIIERAHKEQDMGVVAMKTLKGAKHHGLVGFREEADSYSQAALKWALSNENVSCAVISFFELQHVDEFLYASGKEVTARDLAILQKYDRQIVGEYCAPHCGECLDSCPEHLPIHDVLRYRMYFEDYGWEKEGMRLYSKLEKGAEVCASCAAPCLGKCPVGVPIQERMQGAHDLLTLG